MANMFLQLGAPGERNAVRGGGADARYPWLPLSYCHFDLKPQAIPTSHNLPAWIITAGIDQNVPAQNELLRHAELGRRFTSSLLELVLGPGRVVRYSIQDAEIESYALESGDGPSQLELVLVAAEVQIYPAAPMPVRSSRQDNGLIRQKRLNTANRLRASLMELT